MYFVMIYSASMLRYYIGVYWHTNRILGTDTRLCSLIFVHRSVAPYSYSLIVYRQDYILYLIPFIFFLLFVVSRSFYFHWSRPIPGILHPSTTIVNWLAKNFFHLTNAGLSSATIESPQRFMQKCNVCALASAKRSFHTDCVTKCGREIWLPRYFFPEGVTLYLISCIYYWSENIKNIAMRNIQLEIILFILFFSQFSVIIICPCVYNPKYDQHLWELKK